MTPRSDIRIQYSLKTTVSLVISCLSTFAAKQPRRWLTSVILSSRCRSSALSDIPVQVSWLWLLVEQVMGIKNFGSADLKSPLVGKYNSWNFTFSQWHELLERFDYQSNWMGNIAGLPIRRVDEKRFQLSSILSAIMSLSLVGNMAKRDIFLSKAHLNLHGRRWFTAHSIVTVVLCY